MQLALQAVESERFMLFNSKGISFLIQPTPSHVFEKSSDWPYYISHYILLVRIIGLDTNGRINQSETNHILYLA